MVNDQSFHHACLLYEALESLLGDWYLYSLSEIGRDDINEGSAQSGMKILKSLQMYRAEDKQGLAIAQREK
jgi:hypothetical protein